MPGRQRGQRRYGSHGGAARGERGLQAALVCARPRGVRSWEGVRPRESVGPDARGPLGRRVALRTDVRSRRAETGAPDRGLAQIDLVNARLTALYSKNLNWMKFSPKTNVVV
jgi:hypothetical protein